MSLKDLRGWKIFMRCHVYLTKKMKNPIPADIIHLHNPDLQHLSVLHCPKKERILILGRAISGLTAAQTESLFNGKRLFLGGKRRVHRCVYPSSSESLLHILSLPLFNCHLPWLRPLYLSVFLSFSCVLTDSTCLIRKSKWYSIARGSTLERWRTKGGGGVLQAVSLKKKKHFHSTTVCGNSPPISHFHTDNEFLPRVLWIEALVQLNVLLSVFPPSHKTPLSLAWNNRGLLSRKKNKKHNRLHTMYFAYILHSLTRQTECKWLLLSQAMNIISTGAHSTLGGCLQETWSCYVHQWGVSFWAIGRQRTHQLGSSNA